MQFPGSRPGPIDVPWPCRTGVRILHRVSPPVIARASCVAEEMDAAADSGGVSLDRRFEDSLTPRASFESGWV